MLSRDTTEEKTAPVLKEFTVSWGKVTHFTENHKGYEILLYLLFVDVKQEKL